MVLSYRPYHSGTKKALRQLTSKSHLIDGTASRESEYHNRVSKNQRNSKIRVSSLRCSSSGDSSPQDEVLVAVSGPGDARCVFVSVLGPTVWVKMTSVVAQHANRGLECPSKGRRFNSTMTAYYPDYSSEEEAGYLDSRGKQLRTLQEFLDGRSDYVTAAMDSELGVTYGRAVCIPELNQHFGRPVRVEVRDTDSDMAGAGAARIDICVRSEVDSYDRAVNKAVTLVLL
uniref:Uncharacterized protein n=2 Tax=Timema TaxID=61471 RepID=A0A7R9P081_9NEOP|nr:unnamed protein product [Timema tahoe]